MMRLSPACASGPLLAALVWALFAQPSLAQQLATGVGTGLSPWRVAGSLLLCLVLAFGAAVAMKVRMRGGRTGPLLTGAQRGWISRIVSVKATPRKLRHVESLRVGQNVEICLFVSEDRQYLIAASPAGITLLKEGDAPSSDQA